MQDQPDAVTEVPNGDIVFDHVDFSYAGEGGNLSLKNVNLHIESGQTIGIIGGTGSAKSSLVQLIPRLYDVTKGRVKVGGIDVRDYSLESCVTRYPWFFRKMYCSLGTIYENIRWGDETASDEEVKRVCSLRRLTDSFRSSRTVTIQKSSREVTMYPVGRSSVCVSQGRSLRNQRS